MNYLCSAYPLLDPSLSEQEKCAQILDGQHDILDYACQHTLDHFRMLTPRATQGVGDLDDLDSVRACLRRITQERPLTQKATGTYSANGSETTSYNQGLDLCITDEEDVRLLDVLRRPERDVQTSQDTHGNTTAEGTSHDCPCRFILTGSNV